MFVFLLTLPVPRQRNKLAPMGLRPQSVESLPSRASESNDKVVRLECWNHSMRLTKTMAAKSLGTLSEAWALRAGGQ
jgi:hypothetical protein